MENTILLKVPEEKRVFLNEHENILIVKEYIDRGLIAYKSDNR